VFAAAPTKSKEHDECTRTAAAFLRRERVADDRADSSGGRERILSGRKPDEFSHHGIDPGDAEDVVKTIIGAENDYKGTAGWDHGMLEAINQKHHTKQGSKTSTAGRLPQPNGCRPCAATAGPKRRDDRPLHRSRTP
jgi:hypothetical protein